MVTVNCTQSTAHANRCPKEKNGDCLLQKTQEGAFYCAGRDDTSSHMFMGKRGRDVVSQVIVTSRQ